MDPLRVVLVGRHSAGKKKLKEALNDAQGSTAYKTDHRMELEVVDALDAGRDIDAQEKIKKLMPHAMLFLVPAKDVQARYEFEIFVKFYKSCCRALNYCPYVIGVVTMCDELDDAKTAMSDYLSLNEAVQRDSKVTKAEASLQGNLREALKELMHGTSVVAVIPKPPRGYQSWNVDMMLRTLRSVSLSRLPLNAGFHGDKSSGDSRFASDNFSPQSLSSTHKRLRIAIVGSRMSGKKTLLEALNRVQQCDKGSDESFEFNVVSAIGTSKDASSRGDTLKIVPHVVLFLVRVNNVELLADRNCELAAFEKYYKSICGPLSYCPYVHVVVTMCNSVDTTGRAMKDHESRKDGSSILTAERSLKGNLETSLKDLVHGATAVAVFQKDGAHQDWNVDWLLGRLKIVDPSLQPLRRELGASAVENPKPPQHEVKEEEPKTPRNDPSISPQPPRQESRDVENPISPPQNKKEKGKCRIQ